MKFFYVNGVFNFRFYLCVIQKKKTYIVNKPKKIRQKNHHIYMLIVLRERKLNF